MRHSLQLLIDGVEMGGEFIRHTLGRESSLRARKIMLVEIYDGQQPKPIA
ncbi:MAG: hypothetical protein RMK18_10955 [Armatimonadota bacterium]|nr:hypothetical protein [Armatimonadota bacterium]